ncbi:hypothetical protein SAMN02910370_02800 [Lachnospiraceae bacterium XPB1003]|nr:hypothetical protein SAMN02910370_02800 [Lachnospiraceae bacterium XPB1003]
MNILEQFKNVYSNHLIPKGFSLLKSKYPYFIKVTSDEIIQLISVEKKKSDFNPNFECFTIWIGISLITLPMTGYNSKPSTLDNQCWMIPASDFYHRCSLSMDGFEKADMKYSFYYEKENEADMLSALNKSWDELMPFIVDFFSRYITMEDYYSLKGRMRFGFYQDIVILKQKNDEYLSEREKEYPSELQEFVSILENNPLMKLIRERKEKEFKEKYMEYNQWFIDRKKVVRNMTSIWRLPLRMKILIENILRN